MKYDIPTDTREKEKIMGGIFTISQFIFLVIATVFAIGTGMILLTTIKNIVITLVFMVLAALPFLPFAFIRISKMNNMELFEYCVLKFKSSTQAKQFYNINENYDGGK